LRGAAKSPKASRAALDKAIILREAVFRALKALVNDERIGQKDLQIIDEATHEALSNLQLAVKGRAFMWRWKRGENLNRVSWIIAKATAELLVDSQTLSLLRICGGAGCGWAFLDRSRNKSRRWCAMRICGNRDKARRHYEKLRATDVVKGLDRA
jgi:predicted RNA-binding Zn ribbon-like protein